MTAHHPPLHKNNSTVSTSSQSSTNIVGVHYRVGKKLGEGSFGVLYEGKKKKKSFFLLLLNV